MVTAGTRGKLEVHATLGDQLAERFEPQNAVVATGAMHGVEDLIRDQLGSGRNAGRRCEPIDRPIYHMYIFMMFSADLVRLLRAPAHHDAEAARRHLEAAEAEKFRPDLGARPIERVLVIGSGTMGQGIAMSLLAAGRTVTLHDIDEAALTRARAAIENALLSGERKGVMTADERHRRLARLTYSTDLAPIAAADLAIEAIVERLDAKRALFCEIGKLAGAETILATNTSYLDVEDIASAAARPDRVIGMHFFAPAHIMRLVEIVPTDKTTPAIVHRILDLVAQLGKVGVVSRNAYGFIGNRIMQAYIRQAHLMIREGADPAQIDAALERFGMAVGPIRLGDMSGLDVGYHARKARRLTLEEQEAFALADRLVEMGRLGQKTSAGFYDYEQGDRTPRSSALVRDLVASTRRQTLAFNDERIAGRCLFALVNEAFRVLDEGVARSGDDIDLIYRHGYGFPQERGGPIWWATRQVGLPGIVAALDREHAATGHSSLAPTSLLRELAETQSDQRGEQ